MKSEYQIWKEEIEGKSRRSFLSRLINFMAALGTDITVKVARVQRRAA